MVRKCLHATYVWCILAESCDKHASYDSRCVASPPFGAQSIGLLIQTSGVTKRSDIHKVIVERPRYGYCWAEPVRTSGSIPVAAALVDGEDYDSGPRRAPRFDKNKSFNEYLAPLKGYLLKQVGRPWDNIYAEICAGFDRRSVIGAHVLQHVPDFVALPGDNRDWPRSTGLYVHPRTGILRRKPEPRRRARPAARPRLVQFAPNRAYKRYGELWFDVTYHEEEDERGGRRIVIDSKRQCNKKEIARISAGSTSRPSSVTGSKKA